MILCCGEALIDMVPAPLKEGRMGFEACCGGSVFNTAIGLGRLEAPSSLFTAISQDEFGGKLLSALSESNVNVAHIISSPKPSPLAFAHVSGEAVRYQFYQDGCAEVAFDNDQIDEVVARVSSNVEACFFGGISLCNGIAAEIYSELALKLAKTNFLMLDPNIRPAFVEDEEAYRRRLSDLLAIADVIKISQEDLAWIAKGQPGYHKQLSWFRQQTNARVIVTRGSLGAYLYGPNDLEIYSPAPPVQVKDPIGAGDSFNAGFLAMLHKRGLLSKGALDLLSAEDRGYQLQSALNSAVHVASLSLQKAGANPPWRSELEEFMEDRC